MNNKNMDINKINIIKIFKNISRRREYYIWQKDCDALDSMANPYIQKHSKYKNRSYAFIL